MNIIKKITSTLTDLKENHNVISLKAEFAAEGSRLNEVLKLKDIATNVGLDLTIKIGGCKAIKDLYDARQLEASTIVAPMIETAYAMKKYVETTQLVFSKDERKDLKILINTETITGYSNLNNIISSEDFAQIDGIVLGRTDMTCSMGLTKEEVNSEPLLNIAKVISNNLMAINKEFVIGGGVSTDSIPFFKQIPYLNRFETRKVIFDAQKALTNANTNIGILKAIDFELMWLKNKHEFFGTITKEDESRIQILESFCKSV